jgi:hypothetical protein
MYPLLLVLAALAPAPAATASCPVTLAAEKPFAEPSPSSASRFWYGSEELAVLLTTGGTWQGNPQRCYRNKLWWWRRGFDGRTESSPALALSGRRLDASAPLVRISNATNGSHPDFGGWAMLTAVEFPSAGCWELTGDYRGSKLRFVVSVGS